MFLVCRVLVSDAGEAVDAASAEAVAGAFEGEDVGVVDDAVDHCGGDGLVSEDGAPAGEWQVAGQDQGCVFVAGRDELEEQVRGVLLEREVADLVDLCGYPHRSTYAEPVTMSRKATSGAQSLDGAGFLRPVVGSDIGIVTG